LTLLMGKNKSKTIDGRRIYSLVVDESRKKENVIIKKVLIKNYINIWSDHDRKDLEYIEIAQKLNESIDLLPIIIKIKFKGIVFKLRKI